MYILALRAGSEPSLRSAPSSAKRTKPACAVAAIADANSLVEVELDQPQIKPNDLLVRVKAVSVNPADAKIRIRSAKDPQPEARILGYDAVGIVEEIGDAVEGFKTGDRVWYAGDVTRKGSNAELQAVDARIVSHVAEFLEKHPNIELKLSLSDNIVDIVEMGFDLAIRVGSLTSSTLLARKLAENPRILVASPEYLKKHGVPQLTRSERS